MIRPNRARATAGAILVCLTITGACVAADPVHSFECDTPAGHFGYWSQSLNSGPVEISGTVTVNEVRDDKKWSPLASVVLEGGSDGKTRAGLHLYSVAKVKDMYFVEMMKPDGKEALGIGGMIPRTKDPIPFKLVLDALGKLTVNIGGAEGTSDLGAFQPRSVSLNCSTGDFEFKNVTVRESTH